jgi:hypothetical protein
MKTTIGIRVLIAAAVVFVCAMFAIAAESPQPAADVQPVVEVPPVQPKPLVQMAILLDTSGSMSGLIDQARTELWSIVNEFILAERGGRQPEIQVALYEYGNTRLSSQSGWIRQVIPFTTDLDKVSEELFALTTNGGEEYCGWVIREATQKLAWSGSPDDLKVIFIAGNEPFTQGPVDYREVCKAAIAKGIIVNTIHCGREQEGVEGKWKDGAVLADGRHLNINQNQQVVHIPAPQDREIADLGLRLNLTYIPFGTEGHAAQERQAAQDNNAANLSPQAGLGRALTKASRYYRNSAWDLVDAVKTNQVDLGKVKDEELPRNMQEMSPEERNAYVTTRAKERVEIQARIQKLNEQRNRFVAEKTQDGGLQADTLGSAIKQAVRAQAAGKNYTFKPAGEPSSTGEVTPEKK